MLVCRNRAKPDRHDTCMTLSSKTHSAPVISLPLRIQLAAKAVRPETAPVASTARCAAAPMVPPRLLDPWKDAASVAKRWRAANVGGSGSECSDTAAWATTSVGMQWISRALTCCETVDRQSGWKVRPRGGHIAQRTLRPTQHGSCRTLQMSEIDLCCTSLWRAGFCDSLDN